MWRLDRFGIDDLEVASVSLRSIGDGASTMVEVAGRITRLLHGALTTTSGEPACPLVRVYVTRRLSGLDAERQRFARAIDPGLDEGSRCFTLLGSTGAEPAWCDPSSSSGHLAIPLRSPEAVVALPMVSALFEQIGFTAEEVAGSGSARPLELHHRAPDVFHVPDAKGSAWVPAQRTFVEPYGIRSVLGLGGALATGDLFALLLFASVTVDAETARMLQPLAAALKAALIPFSFRVL